MPKSPPHPISTPIPELQGIASIAVRSPSTDVPALVERLRAMVSGDGRAIVCKDSTTRQMATDILAAADALECLAEELNFARQPRFGEPGYRSSIQPTHQYVAHPKYPWFCKHCGYPPHEALQHPQGDDAPAREVNHEG